MNGEDLDRFRRLEIDHGAIGLEQSENTPYFCTPVDAEFVGWTGCDGIHFIMLPGDERVYCVDPAMGEPGTYVLPVAADLRQFLSFVLFCRDANPISQIWWLTEERFRALLEEDAKASWPGCEEFFSRKMAALDTIAGTFCLEPRDPYPAVRTLQAAFDPSNLCFSREYYDVLGLEDPRCSERAEELPGYTLSAALRIKTKENDP